MTEKDPKYGLPKVRKFPMPDRKHVLSAVRFFNYATPAQEKELASAILRRMKEYGIDWSEFTVGPDNRFRKYIPAHVSKMYGLTHYFASSSGDALAHHGVLGMKWGVRRYQNPDGSIKHPRGTDDHGHLTKRAKRIMQFMSSKQVAYLMVRKYKSMYPNNAIGPNLNKVGEWESRQDLTDETKDWDAEFHNWLHKERIAKLRDMGYSRESADYLYKRMGGYKHYM